MATFTVPHDTVAANGVVKTSTPSDNITNITASNLTLNWHVKKTDFPSDWLTGPAFGICDNANCRPNSGGLLWNETTSTGTVYTSTYYANATHDSVAGFSLNLDLSNAASIGTHYVTINIADNGSAYNKDITFAINKIPSGIPVVTNSEDKIILYPNPADNELNVVYDANADIKNIAVYNVIGKPMTVYKVTGNSANLNIESIPSGIYFVRLFNSNGNVVVTRKFTKQ